MTKTLSGDHKTYLVEEATRLAGTAAAQDQRGASQLRNMLQISQTESEVLVLTNFIRYQAARKASKRLWGPIQQDVISTLQKIDTELAPGDPMLRALAIQHFFGYLVRAYVYEAETRRPKKDHRKGGRSGNGK